MFKLAKGNKLFIYNLCISALILVGVVFLMGRLNNTPVNAENGKQVEKFQDSLPAPSETETPTPPLQQRPLCNGKPCDSENQRRQEAILAGEGNARDVDTIFGHQVPVHTDVRSYENTRENAPRLPNGKHSMFTLKYEDCSADCCEEGLGSGYSCSVGCLCDITKHSDRFAGVEDMKFAPYQNLLNDKYS